MLTAARARALDNSRTYHNDLRVDEISTSSRIAEVRAALWRAFRRSDVQLPEEAWDLTLGQVRLLFAVRKRQKVTMSDVAEMFGVGAAAASGLVSRIERRGFVERAHTPTDRRVVECRLTAAGEALLDELAGVHTQAIDRALAAFTPSDLAEFDRLLGRLAESSDPEQR